MRTTLRRIAIILLTSSGVITTTSLTADALSGINHCLTRLDD